MTFVCAAALAIFGVLHQNEVQRNPGIVHGRFSLPAFDAWVYVAMAEHPKVFTVAPWGYRWLTPAIVSSLPTRTVTAGFRVLTIAALAVSGMLLFLYWRSHRVHPWLAVAGVAVFVLSPSVADIVRYRFLVDPLTVALWIGFLWGAEVAAPTGVLALLATLGVLSKDVFFLVLPHLLFSPASQSRGGRWRRFGTVLLFATAARLVLHVVWPTAASTVVSPGFVIAAVREILASWREWMGPLALGGILPLSLLALLRREGRGFARRHLYLIVTTLALPFAAGVYTGDGRVVDFYGEDIARLLVYALPWILCLGFIGLGGRTAEPSAPARWPRGAGIAAFVLAGVLIADLAASLDRYRRADFATTRDGPLVLAGCRESLRIGRLLAVGGRYEYDFAIQGLPHYSDEPARLREARWFLRRGFGDRAQKATGVAVLREAEGELLVPLLEPKDVDLRLEVEAPALVNLSVDVNRAAVGAMQAGATPGSVSMTLPAGSLYRGDNLVTLRRPPGSDPVTIHRLSLRLR